MYFVTIIKLIVSFTLISLKLKVRNIFVNDRLKCPYLFLRV